jgi:tRNA (guanine-N7-)-methyltransferase
MNFYPDPMSLSLSRGKQLDVGHHGIAQDDLPAMELGTLDPRDWFAPVVDAAGDTPVPPDTSAPAAPPDTPAPLTHLGTPGAADTAPTCARPIELEIGSGKGTFLVQQAQRYPGVDYLGIEWAKAFWRYAADRARRRGLENVRLLRCDAAVFVRHYVPDSVFRQVHIYFPDPWPKKRHHKRRLIQAEFLRELHRVLVPAEAAGMSGVSKVSKVSEVSGVSKVSGVSGVSEVSGGSGVSGGDTAGVRIATDHADYFEWMREQVEQVTDLFDRLGFESPGSAGEGEWVGTNFERKYRREGRPFYGMILRKRP